MTIFENSTPRDRIQLLELLVATRDTISCSAARLGNRETGSELSDADYASLLLTDRAMKAAMYELEKIFRGKQFNEN